MNNNNHPAEPIVYNGEVVEMPGVTDIEALRRVQDCELKILAELDRICKKHNIVCSLTGGTLIGAARHHDFVPWDDDIDVDLRQSDMEKLAEILPRELGEDFEFVNYNDHGEYFCDFLPRIFYKKSKTVNSFSVDGSEKNICNDERMNGIFIELYSLCESKKGFAVNFQYFVTKVIYGLCMGHRAQKKPTDKYSAEERTFSAILESVGKCIPIKCLYKAYELNAHLIKSGKGNVYFKPCVPLVYQKKNILDKKWFESFSEIQVRNIKINAPSDYKAMLTTLYGNWETLPPVKDRHPDHFNLSEEIKID